MFSCVLASLKPFLGIIHGIQAIVKEENGVFTAHAVSIVILFLVLVFTTYGFAGFATRRFHRTLIRNKERERRCNFDAVKAYVGEHRIDGDMSITTLSFASLLEKLKGRKITPSQALLSYQRAALEAQEKFNCVTAFITEANAWAEDLDHLPQEEIQKLPLYGVPFSVKDSFDIKGYDSTSGLAKRIWKPAKETCNVVAHLRSLGAIPFAKTNVPQGLIGVSCNNPVFGLTLNPLDPDRIVNNHSYIVYRSLGGSSSGCAALVAAGGAPFAVGSDIGGSLRMPAAAAGVVSIKFSTRRLVLEHASPYVGGAPVLLNLGYGFIAKDVQTIETVAEALLQAEFFEVSPYTCPIPYRRPTKAHLSIGYFTSTAWYPCIPPLSRAVTVAADALRAAGHTLVPFEFPHAITAHCLAQRSLMQENTIPYSLFDGEDISADQHVYKLTTLPRIYYKIAGWLFRFLGDWRLATQVSIKNKSQTDAMYAFDDVQKYRNEFNRAMGSLDAILCPAGPVITPKLRHLERLVPTNGFLQMVFNMLDLPAGIVCPTKVTAKDVEASQEPAYIPEDRMDALCAKTVQGAVGLPIGVQVVSRPFHEETCLMTMRDLMEFAEK